MDINFWDCPFGEGGEVNVGGEGDDIDLEWVYTCRHPKGNGSCNLENKWGGEKANCILLEEDKI